MSPQPETVKSEIHAKIAELAANLGNDAADLTDDDIIPATGLLDSASILELMVWYEGTYDLPLDDVELTIDNFGSVNAMTEFLFDHKAS